MVFSTKNFDSGLIASLRTAWQLFTLLVAISVSTQAQAEPTPINITADNFDCLRSMTPVRGFFVDNLSGNIDATVAVASSNKGGEYPVGTVIQLVPGEVMVKHPKGVSPATKDWEFFELSVSEAGSKIAKRGFVDVNNQFGGNCFACHVKAKPEWDMICETGHGCDPLPISAAMISVIQKTDPRCDDKPTLTEQDLALLKQLKQSLGK